MKAQKIVFDYSKLKGRIVEKFGTRSAFAKAAGIERCTLSNRLRNKSKWPADDVLRVCEPDLLDIPHDQIHVYFFTPKF